MFKFFFKRYARAISDAKERKSMLKLYSLNIILAALFMIVAIVYLILESTHTEDSYTEIPLDLLIAAFVFVAVLLAWFTSNIIFTIRFNKILARPAKSDEMPEIVKYRQKLYQQNQRFKKRLLLAAIPFGIGVIATAGCIIFPSFASENGEINEFMLGIGICILLVSLIISSVIIALGKPIKQSTANNLFNPADDIDYRAIDEAQGREYKQSFLEDQQNTRLIKALFPDSDLLEKFAKLQKANGVYVIVAMVIAILIYTAFIIVFTSTLVNDWNFKGYALPMLIVVIFIVTISGEVIYGKKYKDLMLTQKRRLEGDPNRAKHYELISFYSDFNKHRSKLPLICVILSLITGFTLAIIFPTEFWSTFALVPLIVGLIFALVESAPMRKKTQTLIEMINSSDIK